jgi:hypothetical protein
MDALRHPQAVCLHPKTGFPLEVTPGVHETPPLIAEERRPTSDLGSRHDSDRIRGLVPGDPRTARARSGADQGVGAGVGVHWRQN